jgi:hypothetical protein
VKTIAASLPVISTVFLLLLLCVVPFAGDFTPRPASAAQRQLQALLMHAGIVISFLSLVNVYLGFACRAPIQRIGSLTAASLACFSIGWRCMPYWVMGVYSIDLGHFPRIDMDPKGLFPMRWIGELWRIGVILMSPVTMIGAPVLILGSVRTAIRRQWADAAMTFSCAVLAGGFLFWCQEHYGAWLMG